MHVLHVTIHFAAAFIRLLSAPSGYIGDHRLQFLIRTRFCIQNCSFVQISFSPFLLLSVSHSLCLSFFHSVSLSLCLPGSLPRRLYFSPSLRVSLSLRLLHKGWGIQNARLRDDSYYRSMACRAVLAVDFDSVDWKRKINARGPAEKVTGNRAGNMIKNHNGKNTKNEKKNRNKKL